MRGASWFSLLLATSCAPLASLRPAGELLAAGRSGEVGAAIVDLGPRPYVVEEWHRTGQAWGTWAVSRSVELSVLTAFDDSGMAGGGALRWTPLRVPWFALGGEVNLGYAWAAFAVPFAARPVERVWIYSAPRLGNQGVRLTPAVPLGVSIETLDGLMLRGEANVSWADFDAVQRRTHLAAGLAYQW